MIYYITKQLVSLKIISGKDKIWEICKVKEISDEKRDAKGRIIKNYSDILDMLNQIGGKDQNYSYSMSSSTNNLRPLTQKRK